MRSAGRKKIKKKKTNIFGIILISFVVIILTLVLNYQMDGLETKNRSLIKEEKELQGALAEEQDRTLKLEEQRVYVQTKKYVEEIAKRIGFVYPDEIIFKPKK